MYSYVSSCKNLGNSFGELFARINISGMKERLKRSVRMRGMMSARFRLVLNLACYFGGKRLDSLFDRSEIVLNNLLHISLRLSYRVTECDAWKVRRH